MGVNEDRKNENTGVEKKTNTARQPIDKKSMKTLLQKVSAYIGAGSVLLIFMLIMILDIFPRLPKVSFNFNFNKNVKQVAQQDTKIKDTENTKDAEPTEETQNKDNDQKEGTAENSGSTTTGVPNKPQSTVGTEKTNNPEGKSTAGNSGNKKTTNTGSVTSQEPEPSPTPVPTPAPTPAPAPVPAPAPPSIGQFSLAVGRVSGKYMISIQAPQNGVSYIYSFKCRENNSSTYQNISPSREGDNKYRWIAPDSRTYYKIRVDVSKGSQYIGSIER